MIAFLPLEISTTYNSTPLENISDLDRLLGYPKDTLRIFEKKIYKTATIIHPLAHFIWNDGDSSNEYAYDLQQDEIFADPANVPIINGVTVVYVISNDTWYIAKITANVDFTTEDIENPANFNVLTAPVKYRKENNLPDGRNNTAYWLYEKSTNATTMFDGSLNKQTTNDRQLTGDTVSFDSGTSTVTSAVPFENFFINDKIEIRGSSLNDGEYKISSIAGDKLSFTVIGFLSDETAGSIVTISALTYIRFTYSGIDKIAFFNIDCDEIEVRTTVNAVTTIVNLEMIDTSKIIDFESFCFDDEIQLSRDLITIERDYGVVFEITFKGAVQGIGEILIGKSRYVGYAEDITSLGGRSYGEIIETDSGEVYFDESDSQLDIIERINYTIKVDTDTLESQNEINKGFLNKRLVLSGSQDLEGELRYLITYGYGKDYTLLPKSTETTSRYKFEFRSFL